MEILDKEVKRNNAILTKNNVKLHNSLLEMRGVYVLLKRRNLRLMRDNTRLYRMIRLMSLQEKNSSPSPQAHLALETLAEVASSLKDPMAAHEVVVFPNPMQGEGVPDN